jgi:hypothetical protein
MRRSAVFVAVALGLAAGLVAAQEQAPKPAPKEEPPRLNLRLDQPARFYTSETPGEKKPSDDKLPSLGDSAKPMERPAPSRGDSTFSYPNDSTERK